MNINDIAITSLEVISGFDIATGAYLFTLDELQSASIANSEEKQDIVGKQGRKLTSLKKNHVLKTNFALLYHLTKNILAALPREMECLGLLVGVWGLLSGVAALPSSTGHHIALL